MNMSENDLKEIEELGFEHTGEFFVNQGKVEFRLTRYRDDSGIYAFIVGQNVAYIGTTDNTLKNRMNQYRNPDSSQQTNKRINSRIAASQEVQIYFVPESRVSEFATIVRRGNVERQIQTDMKTFERVLISMFKPEWNLA